MVFHSLPVVSSPLSTDRRRSHRIGPVGGRTPRRRRESHQGARDRRDLGSFCLSRNLLHGIRPLEGRRPPWNPVGLKVTGILLTRHPAPCGSQELSPAATVGPAAL